MTPAYWVDTVDLADNRPLTDTAAANVVDTLLDMETDIILPPDSLDDENGNCKRCGHPFNPHIIAASDANDFSKGGEMRCPVENCECFATVHFEMKDELGA